MTLLHILFGLVVVLPLTAGFPAQGHWEFSMHQKHNGTAVKKSMYKHSMIKLTIHCQGNEDEDLNVRWKLFYLQCSNIAFEPEPGLNMANQQDYWRHVSNAVYESPQETVNCKGTSVYLTDRTKEVLAALNMTWTAPLASAPNLNPNPPKELTTATPGAKSTSPVPATKKTGRQKRAAVATTVKTLTADKVIQVTHKSDLGRIAEIPVDGIYIFTLEIESKNKAKPAYNVTAELTMIGPYGYLSVIDWPMLPFYGTMCVIYIMFGFIWFVLCACNWRDLLRIQLWIGAIIILGMLEKAVFFAEYERLNVVGHSVPGAVVFAELVSCVKRALARMLVVIISLGFGIVKPRLGPMLHRIVGMGVLYFVLASIEGCMRALKVKSDETKKELLAAVPLAVLDATICWWIFTSLVQVMRTLRLRRNLVKLSLYRHFTNTLIFAVLASLGFMIWMMKVHRLQSCITDWKELWVDDAFWHLLFSVILMVIMVLWRPTNTNQRYAFSAISDSMDEQDEAPLMTDAFDGMKMRGANDTSAAKRSDPKTKAEDDLKWIEENIPASVADVALPSLLDSDEEVMTTKFEMSKME